MLVLPESFCWMPQYRTCATRRSSTESCPLQRCAFCTTAAPSRCDDQGSRTPHHVCRDTRVWELQCDVWELGYEVGCDMWRVGYGYVAGSPGARETTFVTARIPAKFVEDTALCACRACGSPACPPPPPLMHPIVDTIPLDQLWVPFRMKTYVGEEASAPAAVPVGAMQASVSACACVCACGQCVCMRVCMCFACLQQLQEVCRHAYDVAVSGRSVVFCDM